MADCASRVYSLRNAVTGSTFVACLAGTTHAITANNNNTSSQCRQMCRIERRDTVQLRLCDSNAEKGGEKRGISTHDRVEQRISQW